MIEPGDVVAEKYLIERVLGRGGMGIVVAATHLHLGQRVALKVLRSEAARDRELVARFLREARAAVRLRGEHVGKVLDVGTLADGDPYIVMEYLDGHDLASELGRAGPLPAATVVDHVLQACVGLAEAHGAGIVHRDLKPANLFLTRRPDGTPLVKVLDFGIAKAIDQIDLDLTDSAAVMGSPGYMAPEQLRSARDVDVRADIWSLGVVLYELTTGRRPYAATTITELAVLVATEPVPPLPIAWPRGFVAAVMRCLEKDPARRFADVASLAAALAPHGSPGAAAVAAAVARVKEGAPPLPIDDSPEALMNATTLSRAISSRAAPPHRDRGLRDAVPHGLRARLRRFWPALAVVAAGLVLVAILLATGGRTSRTDVSAPSALDAAGSVLVLPLTDLDAGTPATADPTTLDAGRLAAPTGSGSGPGPGSGRGVGSGSGADPVASPTGGGSGRRPVRGSDTASSGSGSGSVGSGRGTGSATGTRPGSGSGSRPPILGDADGDGIPDIR